MAAIIEPSEVIYGMGAAAGATFYLPRHAPTIYADENRITNIHGTGDVTGIYAYVYGSETWTTGNVLVEDRKNGVDGNLNITLLANATGYYEDVSTSTAFADDDDVGMVVTEGTADYTNMFCSMGMRCDWDTDHYNVWYFYNTWVDGNNEYTVNVVESTTATTHVWEANHDCAVVGIYAVATSNDQTTNTAIDLYDVDGATDTALDISITASTTGTFIDDDTSITVTEGDKHNIHTNAPAGAGTVVGYFQLDILNNDADATKGTYHTKFIAPGSWVGANNSADTAYLWTWNTGARQDAAEITSRNWYPQTVLVHKIDVVVTTAHNNGTTPIFGLGTLDYTDWDDITGLNAFEDNIRMQVDIPSSTTGTFSNTNPTVVGKQLVNPVLRYGNSSGYVARFNITYDTAADGLVGALTFNNTSTFPVPRVDLVVKDAGFTNTPTIHTAAIDETENLLPDADVTDGNWREDDEGTDLFASANDNTNATYIKIRPSYSGDTCRVSLDNRLFEANQTAYVSYRIRMESIVDLTLQVRLMEGVTEIASWSHTGITGNTWLEFTQALSSGEYGNIGTFEDLELEFVATYPSEV